MLLLLLLLLLLQRSPQLCTQRSCKWRRHGIADLLVLGPDLLLLCPSTSREAKMIREALQNT
jgi:hypothetical protein